MTIKQEAFSRSEPDRGFTVKAFYLCEPNNGDALIEVYREGEPYRRFLFPAYKIWNIAAHFSDIVDGEIAGDFSGYDLAGWTGFSVIPIAELKPCGKCKGVGAPWNNSASVPCDDCGGTGTSPNGRQTTAGEHHR